MSSNVEIVELTEVKKNKPTVVTGFTGPGFIGNTALMYVVRNKRFPQKAQVKSHLIPPMMLLIEGKPTPVFRIYEDERNKTLYVMSEALITAENAWPIGIKLMEWFREKGVKEIISIEGMPFAVPGEERPIYGFTTNKKDLSRYGVTSTQEGGISGLNAVLLNEGQKKRLSWTSLLVPTTQSQTVDYGGAAAVIGVLNKMFNLDVDPEPLKRSEEIRRRAIERARKGEKKGFLDSLRRRVP
ncbi:MAG: PAC2 family protein [Candidatus Bathyarchaeota archaeon]|jgi:predicted ATP-grasp superfamily ATP-dependent carboligase